MRLIGGVFAFAVLFVRLLFVAEGFRQACPKIANVTINVLTFPASLVQEEPGNFLSLNVIFTKIGRSAVCNCKLHEILGEEGRRVKAEVKRCFGGFGVVVNPGMYRVTITCKKPRNCPKVIKTVDVDAQPIDCGHPGDIDNGNVTFTSATAGSIAQYFCDDGYELQPYPGYIRFCSPSGNWSGELPTCVVDCGPSPQIANATSIGGTFFTSVGEEVRYYCDFGTTLVGNATIVCLDDGTWSDPPMCIPPIDCGPPPQIANATSIGGTFFTSVGDEVRYICHFGTTLMGNATIVCLDDGTWSDPPMCIPLINCGPPPQIANGRVSYFRTTVQSSARYSCNSRYNLEGARIIFCRDDGMWDKPPTCKPA